MTLLLALLLALPSHAGTTKLKPGDRSEAPVVGTPVSLAAIGAVTHLDVQGGTIYLAGQKGVAAVGADGTVKWTLDLGPALQRYVDADATHVAFSSFEVAGVDPGAGLKKFMLGELGDTPTFANTKVGLASTDGQLVWTVDAMEQSAVSPPALSPSSVGVMLGGDFAAHDRGDGHQLGGTHLKFVGENAKFFAGMFANATRMQPLVQGDSFYGSFWGYLLRAGLDGNEIRTATGKGLTAYGSITCGPTPFGDLLVIGNTGDELTRNNFFAVKSDLDDKWRLASKDLESGCGSMAVAGDTLVIATNFWAFGVSAKGKEQWVTVNKKGGLYPSSNRGVRYHHGMGTLKSHGELLAATAEKVFIATGYGSEDTITVLDAATGERTAVWNVGPDPIVSMAIVEGKLAVATTTSLRFVTP